MATRRVNLSAWVPAVWAASTLFPGISLAQSTTSGGASDENEIVELSPFQVSAANDQGYRASNSITGSRFNTPIKDLPFALQAFTSDFINDIHPETLYDVAMYSPGVTYRSTDFTDGNAQLGIRGFNVAQGLYSAQTLRDGLRGPPIMDFSNIDRVEIIKGPASFLYGQLAPGGMVNTITKAPREKFQGILNASYGSYNQYGGMLDLTGPLRNDILYRMVYTYSHDMEYWEPYDSYQWDFAPQFLYKLNEKTSVSLKMERFEKRESPQLFQKPQYSGTRSGLPTEFAIQADPLVSNPVLPAGLPSWILDLGNDPNLSGVIVQGLPRTFNQMSNVDFRNSTDTNATATLDVQANENWSLRVTYGYDKNKIDMTFSGRPVANPNVNAYTAAYNAAIAAGQTPAQAAAAAFPSSGFAQPRRYRWQIVDKLSNSVEAQALGKFDLGGVSLKLILGAQYNPSSARIRNAQTPDSANPVYNPNDPLPPWDLRDPGTWNREVPELVDDRSRTTLTNLGVPQVGDTTTRLLDRAVYAGATWGFLEDKLLVITGTRYTNSSLQNINNFDWFTLPGSVIRTATPEFTSSKSTPQLAALYKIRPEFSVFASYSKSFVPGIGTLTVLDKSDPTNWEVLPGDPIQPTQGEGYDIGMKADLFNGRLSGTLSYYQVENSNILVSLPVTGPDGNGQTAIFFPTFQSGLQRSNGVEFDVTYSPISNWQIYGSASIMDARTVHFISEEEDARLLAIDTLEGYRALSSADQTNWRNVWNNHGKPL
ncbi:MAG TPA: TonB-dependent receptor [Opitutaceae bacterium]